MATLAVPGHVCKLCHGRARVNTGWLTSGEPCRACASRGYTVRRQRRCLLCGATGRVNRGWMSNGQCPACEGACFVTRKQVACRRCEGTGTTSSGVLGLSSAKCPACYGQCFMQAKQFPCARCGGEGTVRSGMLGVTRAGCSSCEGAGVVHFRQHKCRKCGGTGSVRGSTCTLCEGRCYLAFEHTPCPSCGGAGKVSGWLSSTPCAACEGTSGYVMLSRIDVDSGDSDSSLGETDGTASGYTTEGDAHDDVGRPGHRHRDAGHAAVVRPHTLPRWSSETDMSLADDESPTPAFRGGRVDNARAWDDGESGRGGGGGAGSGGRGGKAGTCNHPPWARAVAVPAFFLTLFLLFRLSNPGIAEP